MPQTCSVIERPLPPPIKAPEPAEIKAVDMPEFVSFTAGEISGKTEKELISILSGESHPDKCLSLPTQTLITTELLSRSISKASKPHWSVTPTFWIVALGFVVSAGSFAIAAQPFVQRWITLNQSRQSLQTIPSDRERQENSRQEYQHSPKAQPYKPKKHGTVTEI